MYLLSVLKESHVLIGIINCFTFFIHNIACSNFYVDIKFQYFIFVMAFISSLLTSFDLLFIKFREDLLLRNMCEGNAH